jgi:hypothetical protein
MLCLRIQHFSVENILIIMLKRDIAGITLLGIAWRTKAQPVSARQKRDITLSQQKPLGTYSHLPSEVYRGNALQALQIQVFHYYFHHDSAMSGLQLWGTKPQSLPPYSTKREALAPTL